MHTNAAIIGVMSLVTVPQFIGYQHSAALKGAMRNFNADIRNCRQLAVSRYVQVRLEFTSANSYSFFYRTPGATTWWWGARWPGARGARWRG